MSQEINSAQSKKSTVQADETIRYLAFILRHRPHEAKIKLNEGGWAEVSLLVSALAKFKKIKITAEELVTLVRIKSKNSFTISEDGKTIKAKSGHTVLLGFVEADKVPSTLFVHIYRNEMTSVFGSGLTMKPGGQLVERLPSTPANNVILVSVNTSKARRENVKFYRKDDSFFAFHLPAKCLTFSSF